MLYLPYYTCFVPMMRDCGVETINSGGKVWALKRLCIDCLFAPKPQITSSNDKNGSKYALYL